MVIKGRTCMYQYCMYVCCTVVSIIGCTVVSKVDIRLERIGVDGC